MPPRERSPEELAEDIAGVRSEVQRLADRFDSAPYVRSDLHTEQIGRLRDDVGAVRALSMWTLGLMCSSIVGAIIVLVISVGRGA